MSLMQGHWYDADPGDDDNNNASLKTFLSELDD